MIYDCSKPMLAATMIHVQPRPKCDQEDLRATKTEARHHEDLRSFIRLIEHTFVLLEPILKDDFNIDVIVSRTALTDYIQRFRFLLTSMYQTHIQLSPSLLVDSNVTHLFQAVHHAISTTTRNLREVFSRPDSLGHLADARV